MFRRRRETRSNAAIYIHFKIIFARCYGTEHNASQMRQFFAMKLVKVFFHISHVILTDESTATVYYLGPQKNIVEKMMLVSVIAGV